MSNQEIIDQAINVLEKDAAILDKLLEMPNVLLLPNQYDILLGMSKLSTETMELLKNIKL